MAVFQLTTEGDTPDTRLAFDWGGVKGSRVLRGASEKRKVQWHFGITSQYRAGLVPYFLAAHADCCSRRMEKPHCQGKRTHRMRRSFAKGWRNAWHRWRDMLLAFLFWLSNGESLIRLQVAPESDIKVELPPLMFVSPVSVSEGEGEDVDEDEEDR